MEERENNKKPSTNTLVTLDVLMTFVFYILGIVHFVFFWMTESKLDGHIYGEPDKYGDYARGLYASEVEEIEKNIKVLWLVFLGLLLIGIAILVVKHLRKGNGSFSSAESKLITALCIVVVVCFIGSIIVSIHYSGYN
ncbi:MAG: hypothetical protein J5584_03480 [Clostridia bacterium]|nr:hypothetical protein [Clostridia bacterium]